ncbi:hypothetical protein ABZ250_29565 [Streptomyces afghaniensis]|uniref:hypothetical protein n=1 Tax=Streptomyces afghaniensis TaxID=66865 RepID=UPI0033A38126
MSTVRYRRRLADLAISGRKVIIVPVVLRFVRRTPPMRLEQPGTLEVEEAVTSA